MIWSLSGVLGLLFFAAAPAKAGYVEDWDSFAVVGIFPREPLRSVTIGVTISTNYGIESAWENDCTLLADGASMTFLPSGLFEIEFPSIAPYRQSQAMIYCNYYTHEPNLGAGFDFSLVEATGSDGTNLLESTAMCLTQADYDNPSHTVNSRWLCGDARENGSVNASDALAVLRSAVGVEPCVHRVCDVDGNGSFLPSDALRVLQFAVGRDVSLLCGGCEP